MGDKTGIEWTDATWNPIRGCSRVSEGCKNCYAERVAARFSKPGQAYARTITDGRWNGYIKLVPDALTQPLRWKRPRRIFVNSMSDLFHENVPASFIDQVFAIMALSKHTFQVLTKRPERMLTYLSAPHTSLRIAEMAEGHLDQYVKSLGKWPLPNVWLGVSVENQRTADERIPLLLQTPAAVRFLSCEPLLGPVDLHAAISGNPVQTAQAEVVTREMAMDAGDPSMEGSQYGADEWQQTTPVVDWVICGGESGPGARPMHPEWARSLRDQCQAAGVPFFFKQWGEWAPDCFCDKQFPCMDIRRPAPGKIGAMFRCGKGAAGRKLDGRTWDEFPTVVKP